MSRVILLSVTAFLRRFIHSIELMDPPGGIDFFTVTKECQILLYLIVCASMYFSRRQCLAMLLSTSAGHLHRSMRWISDRFEAAKSRLRHVSSIDVTKSILRMSRCCVPARLRWLANKVQS